MGRAWKGWLGVAALMAALVVAWHERRNLAARTGCAMARWVDAPARAAGGGGGARGPFGHVFIVVEENANYSDVIGDS